MRTNPRPRPGPLELRAGDARVIVDAERGGRLASWTVGGRELLVGPPSPDDRSVRWGCYLMAPWPGRLAEGRFEWAGEWIRLPRTHGRHAIHGLLWNRAWTVESAGPDAATLSIDLADAGWPMRGRVRHRVRLGADRLELRGEIEADEAMPAALGWHPWFQRRADPAVTIDADAHLATRRMLPTGDLSPVRGRTDLRGGPPLRDRRLDHAYAGARSPAVIRWRDLELRLAFEPSPATVVVFTPPHAVCIEPQTAWPNAFNLAGPGGRAGARRLEAGEVLRARLELELRDTDGARSARPG